MAKGLLFAATTVLAVVGAALLLRCVGPDSGFGARRDNGTAVARKGGSQDLPQPVTKHTAPDKPANGAKSTVATSEPADRSPAVDRFAGLDPISQEISPTTVAGRFERKRLVRASTKYPLVRVEDTITIDSKTGTEMLWAQQAMVADHVLVRLRAGQSREALEAVVERHGFTIRQDIRAPGCFLVATDPASLDSVLELMATLEAAACVDIAEPDYLVQISDTTPNDPSYGSLWGMPKIRMPEVWDMTTGTGGVVVAVFDTGIILDHVDLEDRIWHNPLEIPNNGVDDDDNGYVDDVNGWDFYDGDNDPTDVQGHGTHVAGTIGAVGNNATGVVGVCWNVNIMPIKFFGYGAGQQLEGFASDAMAGVYYVITQKNKGVPVRVTNHSWGGSGRSQILHDALEMAGFHGIIHMAAAGNNGTLNNDVAPHYPASYTLDSVVAVANTTQTDGLNSVSHYGATSVDLGAPGVSTYSTSWSGGYEYKSGTSMSTPHVSGVAALMLDYLPHLTIADVRQAILDGVDPIPALSGKCVTEGRLNALGAFETVTPLIEHEPLDNTTDVESDHVIDAYIRPSLPILDTNNVVVLWNMTGNTNNLTTNAMVHVGDDLFRAIIPAQPQGNRIHYMIRAETTGGLASTYPEGAPGTLHSFDVTYPVSIMVIGTPANHGTVDPPYGNPAEPWGSSVTATASLYADETSERRLRCTGWYGSGSVPWVGTSNSMSFLIHENDGGNVILWTWGEQFAFTQTSIPAGLVEAATWWDSGSSASTVTAPALIEQGGTSYAFAYWRIDGSRRPEATATAVNPASGIVMTDTHSATAIYLPENQDSDGDGLPDWWELFHFANLDSAATGDPDNDGFDNASELEDIADPRDAASTPMSPTVVHTPLADPMGALPPWELTATVTDHVGVADVSLVWQRNGGGWTTSAMTNTSGDVYTGEIPPPHELGDNYAYRIEATDTVLNTGTSTVYTFLVAYPVASAAPDRLAVRLYANASTTKHVSLVNDGNAALTWTLSPGWMDPIAADEGDWTHSGPYEQWHIATTEVHSEPHAWYCGNETLNTYNHLMDASLVTPAVTLGASPMLTFWQWAEMEYDGREGYEDYYWDGAVVDVSTNDGASFERIVPVGGYPFKITPNDDSPFPYDTPCLGGTGGWEQVAFDLDGYAGETVRVRFRFGSDRYSTDRGWFIDDVQFSWSADWLGLTPTSGVVAAQSAESLLVRLDATGLPVGSYYGALPIACNDPTLPVLAVPVTLHVTEGPPGEASIALDEADPNTFVITWESSAGWVYSLLTNSNLIDGANWTGVPGFTNLPGVDDTMSYTGTLSDVSTKFYRVNESLP